MKKLLILLFLTISVFAITQDEKAKEEIDNLKKPLFHPFVENYILNEIKQLREENRDLKIELHNTLAKKEVEISSNAINYATSTLNNMFYIIAAASSILVIMGWSSIKDMNEKIKNMIDDKSSKILEKYEERMSSFEKDLESRTKQIKRNEQKIETANNIHSLWMRASQETTLTGKIEIYDEILALRPDEVEAYVYKASAILNLGEANWALNITNQAIEIDDNYASAFYQRAKVYAVLNNEEYAIEDLQKAIELNEEYIDELQNDKEFDFLRNHDKIKEVLTLQKEED